MVQAATYFPSTQTTYNNETTGMQAADVQGAIDELYMTCAKSNTPSGPTVGDTILNQVNIVTSGDGLYEDEYENGYIFKGANPNNYIFFDEEIWRILSIKIDGTIKIIRNKTLADGMTWDSLRSLDWNNASLNTYLNDTYINTLSDKDKIATSSWDIGEITEDNNNLANQINDEKRKKWNGDIALITVSEYIRTNSNSSSCGTLRLNNDNYDTCKNTTWLYLGTNILEPWWTITPSDYELNPYVFLINSYNGLISRTHPDYYDYQVLPTLYLKSDIKIINGNGSQSNPFRIE